MLKIITATHRLFFSKESTIFVILINNKNRKNIRRRGRKTSERHKISEEGAELEEPLIFRLFHSCKFA